jgi:Cu/Ag efflux pump CusA
VVCFTWLSLAVDGKAMHSVSRLLFWAAVLVLACGCTKPEPRMLRISVDYPASPELVAGLVAEPVLFRLLPVSAVSDIKSITSISSEGRLETYVIFKPSGEPSELLQDVRLALQSMTELPPDATTPVVELLPMGATVPIVNPIEIDCVRVEVNSEARKQRGISWETLETALREHAAGSTSVADRLEKAQAIRVSGPDGREVPLSELAEITIEKQPSHIVTRWPGEVPSGAAQTTLDERIGDLQ